MERPYEDEQQVKDDDTLDKAAQRQLQEIISGPFGSDITGANPSGH